MIVLRITLLTVILSLACLFTLPPPTTAHSDMQIPMKGIEALLATGVVAKFLQKKKHAGCHRSAGHQHHHHANPHPYHAAPLPPPPPPPPPPHRQHGAPSIKIIVPQRPEVHYVHQQPSRSEPEVSYEEEAYPERTYAQSARLVHHRAMPYPRLPPHLMRQHSTPSYLIARGRRLPPRKNIEVIRF